MAEPLLTRYLQPLMAGRRSECFQIIEQALREGKPAQHVMRDVVWPAITQVERLYREDQVNAAVESMAARINRAVASALQPQLPKRPSIAKRAVVLAGDHAHDDAAAQMTADLLQSEGWEVYLLAASVPYDEIVTLVGRLRPHVLAICGTQPQDVPNVRWLIAHLREIDACPTMNVIVSGGVFNRAEGLWQEVAADRFAENGPELARIAADLPPRAPGTPRPTGVVKKRHRRRKVGNRPPRAAVIDDAAPAIVGAE